MKAGNKKTFQPIWYTIPEFADRRPLCVYHKEQAQAELPEETRKNLHVLARTELFCQSEGEAYRMQITADDYYKLYVNGVLAGQGPAPAYPEHYYYNEIDLAPYLKAGSNVLGVHLYYQGTVNRVWNSGDGRFGMACSLFDAQGKETVPVWNYRITKAFWGEVTGYDTQFLENFDGRLWDSRWNSSVETADGWEPMVPCKFDDHVLHRQPTKMLQVYEVAPVSVKLDTVPDGTGKRQWKIDFGKEITGVLKLKAKGRAGERICIRQGEELLEDGNVRYQMRCGCRYEEYWTLHDGENASEFYDYKGFRYVQLLAPKGIEITKIRAEVRHYPMPETLCTLESSTPYLSQIFEICKNAVRCGTQEGYLDCPTREKGQYLGDALVTAHAQVWLGGSMEMLRKCITQFAQTAGICKGLMAVTPGSCMQEIADFSLLWSRLLLLDYRFTGDKDFLCRFYPTARGILEYFAQYAREDGLLEQVKEKWNLVDWPENLRDGYDFTLSRPVVAPGCHNVINALYVGAIKTLQQIEKILEVPEEAAMFPEEGGRAAYERRRQAFLDAFYLPEKKRFRDSESSGHCSLHANIYPLYFGLCPKESVQDIADFMLEKGFSCGVYLSYFYLKGLAGAGRYEDVFRMLLNESEHGWVNMLREGATACFEAWGKEQKWNTSLCHPWGSAPIPVLIEDIAGFTPDPQAEEGYHFTPHIPASVEDFVLRIPFRGREFEIKKKDGETAVSVL